MATVEKRGSTWCVRYRVRDEFGNLSNSKRKSGFPDRNSAMKFAAEIEQKANAGVDVHGDRLTCGEIMEKWFDSKVGQIEATTLSRYSQQIDRLKQHVIYTTVVRNLKKESLQALIDDLKNGDETHRSIAVSTAIDYTDPFRFALKWASDQGMIPSYPFSGVKLPKVPPQEKTFLSERDVNDLIAVCKERNPAYLVPLYLALYGGMCREEVAGLKWDHVDLQKGIIRIDTAQTMLRSGQKVTKSPKTGLRSRSVPMPEFVINYLKERRHTSIYVSVSRSGQPYGLYSYADTLARLIEYANRKRDPKDQIPHATYHDLRHTHAAMLIALGVQAKVIQERLGHSSIKITMDLYGYLMPGLQEGVADVLDQKWGT